LLHVKVYAEPKGIFVNVTTPFESVVAVPPTLKVTVTPGNP
jgi:hypothetical protein